MFPAFIATTTANGRAAVLTATVVPAVAAMPLCFAPPAHDASPHQAADAIAASATILADWLDKPTDLAAAEQTETPAVTPPQ